MQASWALISATQLRPQVGNVAEAAVGSRACAALWVMRVRIMRTSGKLRVGAECIMARLMRRSQHCDLL